MVLILSFSPQHRTKRGVMGQGRSLLGVDVVCLEYLFREHKEILKE